MNKLGKIIAVASAIGVLAGLSGCGTSQAAGSESNVTIVKVGTEGTYAPFTYRNDKNEIDGFDVNVIKAIDERLPQYQFEFEPIEWSSLFSALDSGKIDTIANQISQNDERKAKYLFNETPYSWAASAIVYKKGRTDIKTVTDLHGKTVDGGLTTSHTVWLEQYNKEHGNKIKINYTDGDASKMLQDIVNGRADATISSPVTTDLIAKQQGLAVDWTLWPEEGVEPTYFPFQKTDKGERLRKAIDPVIKELLKDGTIKKLSDQYLGADYSTKEAIETAAKQ